MKVLLFALAALAGLTTAVTIGRAEVSSLPVADPAYTEILTADCWEPDIINRSESVVTFAVQAVLGDGEQSEWQTTEKLQPGQRAHLHLFESYWNAPDQTDGGVFEVTIRAGVHGCNLDIRLASAEPPLTRTTN